MANSPLSSLDAAAKFLLMTDVKNISLEGQRAKCGQSGKKRVSSLRVLLLQRLHKNNDNDTIIIIIIIIIVIIIIQLLSIIIAIKHTGKLEVTIRLEVIQKAALLGTAEITESFFHFGTQTQGLLWGLRNLLLLALRQ